MPHETMACRKHAGWHVFCLNRQCVPPIILRMPAPLHALPFPPDDHDALLLEGLFQLALAGDIDSREFEKIEQEVHARLVASYPA